MHLVCVRIVVGVLQVHGDDDDDNADDDVD